MEPYHAYNKLDDSSSSSSFSPASKQSQLSTLDLDLYDDDEDSENNTLNETSEQEEEDYVCGYPDCKHVAMSKNELANHRRKFGHPKQQQQQQQRRRVPSTDESSEYDESDILTVEQPQAELRRASLPVTVKAKSGYYRKAAADEKMPCDEPGCKFSSQFRSNLARHCKAAKHFSEYLMRTSKVKLDYMTVPDGFVFGQPRGEEEADEEEEKIPVQHEDEGENDEEQLEAAPAAETNGIVTTTSAEYMEEPEDEVVQESKKENLNKFCNFDITGLLDDSDNEDDPRSDDYETGTNQDLKLNFKVL